MRLAELAAETAAAADAARQAEAAAALAAAAEQAERDARAMRLALAEAAEAAAAAAAAAEAARLAAEAAANKDPGDQAVLLELAAREAEVSGGGGLVRRRGCSYWMVSCPAWAPLPPYSLPLPLDSNP